MNKLHLQQRQQQQQAMQEQAMQAQLAMIKKQAQEILQKYGCKKMSEISTLQARLSDMETEIKKNQEEMLAYIEEVNKKKEEKDRILLG